jgi:AcrR family transcriptional regulator
MSGGKPAGKPSFREQQFAVRESAILDAANALMARKGYDLMSMDDVAAEVGIAKGSLYRHFPSKEALAAAAMVRLLRRTLRYAESLPEELPAIARLRTLLAWTLRDRLAGGLPHLPATSGTLQTALLANREYVDTMLALNARVERMLDEARRAGALRADLPVQVALLTLYARSCDPTLDFLRASGTLSDDEIVTSLVEACFGGIEAQAPGRPAAKRVAADKRRKAGAGGRARARTGGG